MELPDDVLVIIRAYAKPCFTYFHEYRTLMKLMGKKEWYALKYKLQHYPEQILPALLSYHSALTRKMELYQEMEVLCTTLAWKESWYEKNRYYNLGFYRRREVEDTFWTLKRLLYTEEEKMTFLNNTDI